MICVILAGGLGTRFAEETDKLPKPLINIGGIPIIMHLILSMNQKGVNEFIVCLGYKGDLIKKFFIDLINQHGDIEVNMKTGKISKITSHEYNFSIKFIETGEYTNTASRLFKVRKYLGVSEFLFTYGDGLSDVDPYKILAFHKKNSARVTVTAIKPNPRFGALVLERSNVIDFSEKKDVFTSSWVNGGFFIVDPSVLDEFDRKEDDVSWENQIMPLLAKKGYVSAFKHLGFWQSMDTIKDQKILNEIYNSGKIPWLNF
jgi:glucose-1-phosphate cytidylyltransferase